MGTYSGFLLLEDLFDDLPDASQAIANEASQLFNPLVKIVEDDCKTLLGKRVETNFSLVGEWGLALDRTLTQADIESALSRGEYYTFVRRPSHCTSEGGICRKCFRAKNPGAGQVDIGSYQQVFSRVSIDYGSFLLSGGENSVVLNSGGELVTDADVYVNDVWTQDYSATLSDDGTFTLTLNNPPTTEFRVVVRMIKDTASPFLAYLSSTYSGNLLGMAQLDTGDLPLRSGLMKDRISDGKLSSLEEELSKYSQYIPETYLAFIQTIKDPLERELYMIALYAVFYDVGV